MTNKQTTEVTKQIRERYSYYKVGDIAVQLWIHGVSDEDAAYILEGGETITARPYDKSQAYLAQVMERMAERIPNDEAITIRRDSACCISGKRQTLANAICKNNATIEARFEALSNERNIVGGKCWKDDEDYYISYWYAKPVGGYTCGCVRHTPEQPMSKLWCECCVGHIKHHFDAAMGVKSTCECLYSALTSCGEKPCTFKFNIIEVVK